jgi:predicted pyridoxine 5'-phosphate oxidase superfamily flavin-nucleotide-binding protein
MNAPDDRVFHAGESLMQERVGMRERMAELGPHVLRPFMTEQHQAFFAQLPFVIVGSVDAEGQPSASILAGAPGFTGSPDPHHLLIRSRPSTDDPLNLNLFADASIALLGIEPHTRRRNRMNGIVERMDADGILVGVRQSFGNCPKYIQARQAEYARRECTGPVHAATALNEQTRSMVAHADTLFIASAHPYVHHGTMPSHGVDVSHRGGKPGFVRIDNDHTLTFPDFSGNRFFNTLGNLVLNPRAGLLFIDFDTGDVLHIAADAEIIFDGPERDAFAGAERLLRLTIRHVTHVAASLSLRWQGTPQLSPYLADTGSWTPS